MIKPEEAINLLMYLEENVIGNAPDLNCDVEDYKPVVGELREFIQQHLTPTFDEVVKAWEQAGYNHVIINEKGNRLWANGSDELPLYISTTEGVGFADAYEEYGISMKFIHAINLTIRYLEDQKEKENENI